MKTVWKTFGLIILLLTTFSYAMFQGGFVSWFLFYSFLPFALYALYLLSFSFNHFTVERRMSKRDYEAHEEATVTIHVKRKSAFPLIFIFVEDVLDSAAAASVLEGKNRNFYFLGFRREISFQYKIDHLPRGEHHFHSIRLMTSDPLGLIEKEKAIINHEKIIVYPSYEQLAHLPLQTFFQSNSAPFSSMRSDMTMISSIREYQPGDRFSWIHWKASAKRGGMVTKEFEPSKSEDVFLIMDSAPVQSFERVVSVTASVGNALFNKGIEVGFLTVDEEKILLPAHKGETYRRQFLYHLAKVKGRSSFPFDEVIVKEKELWHKRHALMLVTSDLSRPLIEHISLLTMRKCLVTIFVVLPKEETISSQQSMKRMAEANGMKVIFINEGLLLPQLMEVNRA